MKPYISVFVESPRVKSKGAFNFVYGRVNGDDMARQLQALLLEKASEGYELVSVTPLNSCPSEGGVQRTITEGLVVVFKLKKNS